MFPGTQPYAMTSKKNCDSDAQGCAQLNGNHEVIAKPSRLFSSLNTLKPLRGTQKTQNSEAPASMPLHPQYFCVFRDGRRPFCVFCGKVRGANGRDKRVPPALHPDGRAP